MKGTRLDENWRPDASLLAWAKGRRPDLDMQDTIEQFIDYWTSKTGKDATKLDWRKTFRNWVRNTRGCAVKPATSPHKPAQPSQVRQTQEQRAANLDRLGAMLSGLKFT